METAKIVRNIGLVVSVILVGLIASLYLAYRWTNTVPKRPKGVSQDAVFLWAPYVGLPAPRRGWWFNCWEEDGHNKCRLSEIDGNVLFEGEFRPYSGPGPLANSQLRIDPEKSREHRIWVGDVLVPLAYLQSGEVLIPAGAYEDGRKLIEVSSPTP